MPPYPKPEKRGKKPPKPLNRGSKPLKRTPLSKKPTSRLQEAREEDKKLNEGIWAERKHECFEDGTPLRGNPLPIWFSHVHSKGARPDLRHNPRNIVLHCMSCHHEWEFGNRENMPKTLKLFRELSVEYPDNDFNR